jgi:hypothetical protein
MALTNYTSPADMVTIKECSALFRETGRPAGETTINRWIAKYDIPTEWEGRTRLVSFSDMLPVHRDEVAKRGSG